MSANDVWKDNVNFWWLLTPRGTLSETESESLFIQKSYWCYNWFQSHVGARISHERTLALELILILYVPNDFFFSWLWENSLTIINVINFSFQKSFFFTYHFCKRHKRSADHRMETTALTDTDTIPIVELIPIPYRIWNWSWIWIDPVAVPKLLKNPYWLCNWCRIQTRTYTESILFLFFIHTIVNSD